MNGPFYLAWRYARFQWPRTAVLTLSVSLCLAIPLSIHWMSRDIESALLHRARAIPFVVGGPGSAVDLVVSAVYLQPRTAVSLRQRDLEEIEADGTVQPVPLIVGPTARKKAIVGTSLGYFQLLDLSLATGTPFTRLGDCIAGAKVARQLGLRPGDSILTDRLGFLNPAGQLPLKMRVTGVLTPTGAVDDDVLFVDIRTAWLIQGLGHGHQDAASVASDQILDQNATAVTVAANVQEFVEVTETNRHSFHFHGDEAEFPLSALLIFPPDEKAALLWEGREQSRSDRQTIVPVQIVGELLELLVNVQLLVSLVAFLLLIALSLLLFLLLWLGHKMREDEWETFRAIGAGRFLRTQLLGYDLLLLGGLSVPLVMLLAWILKLLFQPLLLRLLL